MRLIIVPFLVAALTHAAWAQGEGVSKGPLAVPDSEMSAESESILALQEMQKKLEAAGYKEIQVSPQVFVMRAKDRTGKDILLIVDAETMVSLELDIPAAPSTTGSGSSQEEEKL